MKLAVAIVVGLVPGARARAALYRALLGYRIAPGARVGWGTVLCVDDATIGRSRIASGNYLRGPFSLVIGDDTSISSGNHVRCGDWAVRPPEDGHAYARSCSIGSGVVILQNHYIDATGGFTLGDGAVIGGRGGEIWTHGAGVRERGVTIGARAYVGSRCVFAPGSAVADDCVVGVGSVVSDVFDEPATLIAGNPASVRKTGLTPRAGAYRPPAKGAPAGE